MPARMEVYDLGGRLIVQGDAIASRGEAIWQCADVAAGQYRLVVYDTEGEAIASAPVVIVR